MEIAIFRKGLAEQSGTDDNPVPGNEAAVRLVRKSFLGDASHGEGVDIVAFVGIKLIDLAVSATGLA